MIFTQAVSVESISSLDWVQKRKIVYRQITLEFCHKEQRKGMVPEKMYMGQRFLFNMEEIIACLQVKGNDQAEGNEQKNG